MVNELPLAREKKGRQPVLLVRGPDSKAEPVASSRDKRKKGSPTSRGLKAEEIKNTQRQSKSSCKAKGADVGSSRPKGYRRDHKDRKQNRRVEGEDSELWRSAQELGVTFPGGYCHDSIAHYWTGVEYVNEGVLFRCILCHRHIWLPTYYADAYRLGDTMKEFGNTEGYCRYLNHANRRSAKILIAKLQELERISATITDANKMARVAVSVLGRKNYDRR